MNFDMPKMAPPAIKGNTYRRTQTMVGGGRDDGKATISWAFHYVCDETNEFRFLRTPTFELICDEFGARFGSQVEACS
jgi:hypothetical protein